MNIRRIGFVAALICLVPLAPAQDPTEMAAPADVSVAIDTWANIQASIADEPIAVVDLWSLSCAPCMHEFPGLVRLQSLYGGNVRAVSVSVDYDGRRRRPPQTYVDRVLAFLTTSNANAIDNHLCGTPSDEVLREANVASIPAVLVYQRGRLVQRFVDAGATRGFTYDKDVIPYVQTLLPRVTD